MRCLRLLLLMDITLWAGAQQRCSSDVDLSIPLREVDHGSLGSFYSIARGISETIQPQYSKTTMDEIFTALKTKNVEGGKIFSMVMEEQKQSIIFTAFGIAIALSSLVLGLVVLVAHCTSGRNKKSGATPNPTRLLFLIPLTCSFVFVLTGVIINNQSSSALFSSMENLETNLDQVLQDLNKFSENGKNSLICFADNTLEDTLKKVTTNVQTMPKFLMDTFRELIGINNFDQVDINRIQATITASRSQCKTITDSIKDLQKGALSRECAVKLNALKAIIESLTDQLEKVEGIIPIGSIPDKASKDLSRIINEKTKAEVDTATDKVRKKWDGYRTKAEDDHTISDFLNNVERRNGEVLGKTYSSNVYTTTRTVFAPLVTIPGIIAMLFIMATATLLVISHSGSFLMTGFYLLVLLAFFVITLSSVEYLGGSLISAACQTLFQDPTFSRLPHFDNVELKLSPEEIASVNISFRY
ncbi:hypothetical protein ANCCAN_06576, partial [Ancylostoma caninum]